ncbi:MAG: 3-hydroxyacyl-CoA dehydrogenase [Firmicutes bacterium HGW-Firmicutes-12]|jgi:NAD(P)-dependent dehydrogenase (short-subunit alcohol dehydrogenase family)|nr:MAG: 3-hydroxyacyl-CoA dehydrogenase [Firmicutes bacterium HGW-Firmicutes-12]
MLIKNKTAIISGGASGLGEATARRLLSLGAKVVILDNNDILGNALVEELGNNSAFCKADITKTEEVQTAIDYTVNKFDSLDIAINCAGIAPAMKTVGKKGPHDLSLFKRAIDINLIGTFDLARLAAFKMLSNELNESRERGVIINTSSISAFEGQIGQVAYATSKAGVAGLTICMARDLAADGIRVCTIAPGLFNTQMMAGLPERVKIDLAKGVPFPSRLGNPVEYAMLAQQIIENSMLNGEVIRLDGALRLPPK